MCQNLQKSLKLDTTKLNHLILLQPQILSLGFKSVMQPNLQSMRHYIGVNDEGVQKLVLTQLYLLKTRGNNMLLKDVIQCNKILHSLHDLRQSNKRLMKCVA
mmetsp:Transcript_39293/g.45859  ORF Transcript_39293/g.45859 Transcript_39293/m.45859 type:complete len:102 (-) Transcript_39293:47-352(-)